MEDFRDDIPHLVLPSLELGLPDVAADTIQAWAPRGPEPRGRDSGSGAWID